jgi:tetratricopeptide (TPR) repeat protein
MVAILLLIVACLILTKSRSAYLATLVSVAALCAHFGRSWLKPKIVLATAGALAALVCGAAALGGVDREILTQASKSLGYRWQYWQATLSMIKDHPWLGCGSGAFQDFYTQYKLPEASEEVRDPHNLLFEICATAGIPALLAMTTLLASLAWIIFKAKQTIVAPEPEIVATRDDRLTAKAVAASAAAGCGLAWVVGRLTGLSLDFESLAFCLVVGGAVLWVLRDWIEAGQLPAWLLGIGLMALCVNLLAAGGIAFPGVAGAFWLLSGLIVNDYQASLQRGDVPISGRRFLPIGGLIAMLVAAYACYLTAYGPVLQSYAGLFRAEQAAGANQAAARRDALRAAAIADPLSVEPWRELVDIAFQQWQDRPAADARREFETADDMTLRLQPHSSSGWAGSGRRFLEAFDTTHDPVDAKLAVSRFSRAVELYPNNPTLRAELALALDAAGDTKRAAAEADEARRLDAITPHADKKLSSELTKRLLHIGSR